MRGGVLWLAFSYATIVLGSLVVTALSSIGSPQTAGVMAVGIVVASAGVFNAVLVFSATITWNESVTQVAPAHKRPPTVLIES